MENKSLNCKDIKTPKQQKKNSSGSSNEDRWNVSFFTKHLGKERKDIIRKNHRVTIQKRFNC